MCGRFALGIPPYSIIEFFNIEDLIEYEPRFNIAPTQSVPAIVQDKESHKRVLKMFHWGLIPYWAKDMKIGSRLINARSETVTTKPSFREAFKHRRCLIPTTGFYDWEKQSKRKQPYHIKMKDNEPFAFAGLWESWEGGKSVIESCTILTTEANKAIQSIHDRMPVILKPEDYDMWIDSDNTDSESLEQLLKPFLSDISEVYPISNYVNKPQHDNPQCIQPL